jgi:hypothetical protein
MSPQLDHPELDDFEPVLDRLARTAHSTGAQYMRENGLTLETVHQNQKTSRDFFRKCHYGFDLAQRQAAKLVVEYEVRLRELRKELKEARRAHDRRASDIEALICVIENRQLVLRRLVDSILWVILMPDTWVLRRLGHGTDIKNIDPEVLLHTVQVAVDRNREERMHFNVVSDLTTVIDIGDLVEVDQSHGRRWTILELKEGKINELIAEKIERHDGTLTPDDVSHLFEEHGESVVRQAHRVVRQVRRLDQVTEIVTTDKGIDPWHDLPISLSSERIDFDDYSKAIRRVCDEATTSRIGTATVSGCLRLLAINPLTFPPGSIPMCVAHVCYHLTNQNAICVLGNEEKAQEELHAMNGQPPIVDLVALNLTNKHSAPIFLWTKHERGQDLIFGRLRLFAQWDIQAFFRLAESEGFRLSWVTGKESDDLRNISYVIPGSPNSRGVRVEYPDGTCKTFLSGFFARPLLYLTPPKELIGMMKTHRDPPQEAKDAKD